MSVSLGVLPPHPLVAEPEEFIGAEGVPSLRLPLPGDMGEVEKDVHEGGDSRPPPDGGDEGSLVRVAELGVRGMGFEEEVVVESHLLPLSRRGGDEVLAGADPLGLRTARSGLLLLPSLPTALRGLL